MEATPAIDPDIFVDENGNYKPYEYWLTTCGLDEYYRFCLGLLGDVAGKQALDCGCGIGNTAIMLARRGATVKAFDVDDDVLAKAEEIAKANGVPVAYSNMRFGETDYPSASFDLAFGSCILHHVDMQGAAEELGRVLVPGGRAVFIENSNRNPFLMLARSKIVGRFGVPKYGDDDEEHPLRDDEINTLRAHFPGTLKVHLPALVMFRLLDLYIFQRRSKLLTAMMRGLDRGFGSIPWLRRFSYFQVLEFTRDA